MGLRIALLLVVVAGCTREHTVDLRLDLRPVESSGVTVRGLELRAYRASTCPDVGTIVAGTDSAERAQSFRADGPRAPIGALAEGTWSFAAVARDATCRAVGFGCATVRIGEDEAITVVVDSVPVAVPGDVFGCSGGLGCTDGLCGSAPAMCTERCDEASGAQRCCGTACVDIQNDPAHCGGCGNVCPRDDCVAGRCGTGCEGGACICGDAECREGTCCGERCVLTTSDLANCGACGHVCPPGLGCGAGLCRVSGDVELIEVRLPDARECNPMLAVVVADATSPDGVEGTAPIAQPVGPEGGILALGDPATMTGDGWCSDPAGECEIAAGVVMLLSDRNADGRIEPDEVRSGPLYGVVREGIVVYARRDFRPGDGALQLFAESRGLDFPEGVAAGIYPYERQASGGWLPVASPAWSMEPCFATTCDMDVDSVCRAAQPSPIPR